MSIRCKLLDFNVVESNDSYNIEMFGINEKRETYYINVNDFKSFEECVNYVIQLDEETIQRMSNEPIYTDHEITHLIDDEWNKKNYNKTLNLYLHKLREFLN